MGIRVIVLILVFALRAQGTFVINHGGWYSGTYESLQEGKPAILIQTRDDVFIYHSIIHSVANGIEAWGPGQNVHVIDCYLLGNGTNGHHAIYEAVPQTFHCDMCYFSSWDHGIYLDDPPNTPWTGAVIEVYFNHFVHCQTAIGFYWLAAITGYVSWNEDIASDPGGGDQISFYSTTAEGGTSYLVDNNFVYGPRALPGTSTYTAASIITDGDQIIPSNGMHFSQNQVIQNSAGGIGFAYSTNCLADFNTVVSTGLAPIYSAGLSVYIADKTNIIKNNAAAVFNPAIGQRLDFTKDVPPGWGTFIDNTSLPTIDPYIEYAKWHAKIDQSGYVVIGPDW